MRHCTAASSGCLLRYRFLSCTCVVKRTHQITMWECQLLCRSLQQCWTTDEGTG